MSSAGIFKVGYTEGTQNRHDALCKHRVVSENYKITSYCAWANLSSVGNVVVT